LENIKNFWIKSYTSDRIAFFLELISFVTTVSSSAILAFTADSPDMALIYPGFFVGSIAGAVAYLRRGLGFPLMLTSYFACVNVFGFGVAKGWW
jgi:hypothetical protein